MNHIFWDNSNIFIGAQAVCEFIEGGDKKFNLRINFVNLVKIVFNARVFSEMELGGSVPPECESVWQCARDVGFNTNLLYRVTINGKSKEQAVDEMLHLKIVNAAAKNLNSNGTIVILSGDGKTSEFQTSFPGQAELAINLGWNIENWSWGMSRSNEWDALSARHPGKVTLNLFDEHYRKITYIEQGQCFHTDSNQNKVFYTVDRRESDQV